MTFFAIMLIIAGVVLAVVPDLVFNITQSWKHGNSSEPSDSYRYITRVQGIILVIVWNCLDYQINYITSLLHFFPFTRR